MWSELIAPYKALPRDHCHDATPSSNAQMRAVELTPSSIGIVNMFIVNAFVKIVHKV